MLTTPTTPEGLEPQNRALDTLRLLLPRLDSAALPTKCEVFAICGQEAREIHDAIETLLAARAQGPQPPASDEGEVERFWLVLHEPGCVPELNGPWPSPRLREVLRKFMAARPVAYIDVVTLEHDGPDIQHGPECLQMLDGRSMSVGRRHNAQTRAAHEPYHAALRHPEAGIALSASDAACYRWPGEGEAAIRDAFVQGAEYAAARPPEPGEAYCPPISEALDVMTQPGTRSLDEIVDHVVRAVRLTTDAGASKSNPVSQDSWRTDRLAQARDELEDAAATLDKAADQFAFYADEHAKKGTPEADAKASTNHGWAIACGLAANVAREAAKS